MDMQEKLMQNEELMEGLGTVSTAAELAALLAQHGIELEDGVTAEQILAQIRAEGAEELDEDALDDVSGGSMTGTLLIGGAIVAAYWLYKRRGGGGGHRF